MKWEELALLLGHGYDDMSYDAFEEKRRTDMIVNYLRSMMDLGIIH